jgi:hypothetical protein
MKVWHLVVQILRSESQKRRLKHSFTPQIISSCLVRYATLSPKQIRKCQLRSLSVFMMLKLTHICQLYAISLSLTPVSNSHHKCRCLCYQQQCLEIQRKVGSFNVLSRDSLIYTFLLEAAFRMNVNSVLNKNPCTGNLINSKWHAQGCMFAANQPFEGWIFSKLCRI